MEDDYVYSYYHQFAYMVSTFYFWVINH